MRLRQRRRYSVRPVNGVGSSRVRLVARACSQIRINASRAGAASLVCTVGSLPYVWDFVQGRANVAMIQPRTMLSEALCAFFMGYLASA
jgi:hypothetical protein